MDGGMVANGPSQRHTRPQPLARPYDGSKDGPVRAESKAVMGLVIFWDYY